MANDLNQCTFTGRLGADPEIKSFANGGRIANLRIAVGAQWKDKQGEKQERTEWVSVTATQDGLIGVIERYLRKGSRVLVQGEWRTRKWADSSGNDRYSTECVLGPRSILQMLDPPSGGERKQSGGSSGSAFDQAPDLDDDVPFISNHPALEGRVA